MTNLLQLINSFTAVKTKLPHKLIVIMKYLLLLLFFSIPFLSQAQKVKYDKKTEQVTIDGKASFKIERHNIKIGEADRHFIVLDKNGKRIIRVSIDSYQSTSEINQGNPDGSVAYSTFIFFDSEQRTEMRYAAVGKWIAKQLVKNNIMVDGLINQEAVDEFVLIHGKNKYSSRRGF